MFIHTIFHEKQQMLVFCIVNIVKLDQHIKLCVLLYYTEVIDTCTFVDKCWYKNLTHPTLQLPIIQIALCIFYILCWAIIQPVLSHCSNEELILHQIILKQGYTSDPPLAKMLSFLSLPSMYISIFHEGGRGYMDLSSLHTPLWPK